MKKRIFASAATFGLAAFMSVNAQVNINAATTNVTGTTANLNSTTTNIGGSTTNLTASAINFRTTANYNQLTTHNGSMVINGSAPYYNHGIITAFNKDATQNNDRMAIKGYSSGPGGYGTGGSFEGGTRGVTGYAYGIGNTSGHVGGNFSASNGGSNYGVIASGSGQNATNYGIYASASGGTTNYAGYFSGNVYVSGTVTTASDEKLKNDVLPLKGALDIIMKLDPKEYYYDTANYKRMNLSNKKQRGFVAQDVEKIMPELVEIEKMPPNEDIDGNQVIKANPTIGDTTTTFKGVNYIAMIPILVGAIQEQQKRIEELEKIVGKRY